MSTAIKHPAKQRSSHGWKLGLALIANSVCCVAAVANTANAPALQNNFSPVASLAQLLFGLIIVVGLIFGATWMMKKMGVKSSTHPQFLKIIATLAVSQRERIMLIEAGESWLVVGVAPGRINTLHTLPKGEIPVDSNQTGPAFAHILQKLKTAHIAPNAAPNAPTTPRTEV